MEALVGLAAREVTVGLGTTAARLVARGAVAVFAGQVVRPGRGVGRAGSSVGAAQAERIRASQTRME
jgi:hypothetical protein